MSTRKSIPQNSQDKDMLLDEMKAFRENDAKWEDARTWSMVYHVDDEHTSFLKKAHNMFFSENALNPMAFKSLKRMETEIIDMTSAMLGGDDFTAGTLTSGGTESILLAVKCYRDRARKLKPWIRSPEAVVPETIHVAFDKAAHAFGVRLKKVPVGPDFRVDAKKMKKAISRNTIMVAASAPQYAHGVIDPIEEIGAIAEAKKLPFHVDACFGGFILPWLEKLGYPIPLFDFRVPGVTSISADVHKYGYAPKGTSTILYRNMDYLKHQFFAATDWPGGIYVSPSLPGSRPGGAIAAAWASLTALGEDGFMKLAEGAMEVAKKLRYGIEEIPQLKIMGNPDCTIVTYGAADQKSGTNIYAIADQMEAKGWSVDRQQRPACIHCTVNAMNGQKIELYLEDLKESVAFVEAQPASSDEGYAAMYGMMAKIPARGLVKYSVLKMMESMYAPGQADFDLDASADDDPRLAQIISMGQKGLRAVEDLKSHVKNLGTKGA
jgi:sphinganine-1-phosphate aldolase